ncbi:hypothetical protein P8452_69900 [Trifolium repens]|nr:hypothetical protein P8452_69900 [Trifolium repens]
MWSLILTQMPNEGETTEHVGINNNSIISSVSTPWIASFHSGDTAEVSITYNSTTKNLTVSWKYQTTANPQEVTSLSCQIDLMKILPEWVTIGFSAATGSVGEIHNLSSWEFESTLDKTTNNNTIRLVLILSGVAVVGVVALATYAIIWRRKKRK